MYDYVNPWKVRIARALSRVMKDAGIDGTGSAVSSIESSQVVAEIPPPA